MLSAECPSSLLIDKICDGDDRHDIRPSLCTISLRPACCKKLNNHCRPLARTSTRIGLLNCSLAADQISSDSTHPVVIEGGRWPAG